jgi:hypothetical protein
MREGSLPSGWVKDLTGLHLKLIRQPGIKRKLEKKNPGLHELMRGKVLASFHC